eukprot:jgi/Pico_ML_1/50961/g2075.t1
MVRGLAGGEDVADVVSVSGVAECVADEQHDERHDGRHAQVDDAPGAHECFFFFVEIVFEEGGGIDPQALSLRFWSRLLFHVFLGHP